MADVLKKTYILFSKAVKQALIVIKIKKWRSSYILMSPNSIGEVSIICAFCRAFKEKHSGHLVLVVRSDHYVIANIFKKYIDEILIAPISLMRRLRYWGLASPTSFRLGVPVNLWTKLRGDGRLDEVHELRGFMPCRGGLGFTDLYRHLMHLNWDSKVEILRYDPSMCDQKKVDFNISKINGKKGVLLFPSTNSNKPISARYWLAIAELYNSLGYSVFCNVKGGAYTDFSPPDYVEMLDLDIMSAIDFSNRCESIVIGSNGLVILMLLLKIKANINVLLSDEIMGYDSEKFRPYPMLSTSHRLGTPELISPDINFREFMIDEDVLPFELADTIVNKVVKKFELTDGLIISSLELKRDFIHNFLTYNLKLKESQSN